MNKAINYIVTLSLFCILAAGSLAYVYLYTLPRITALEKLKVNQAVKAVLPEADRITGETSAAVAYYLGFKGKQQIGTAINVAAKGYSAKIKMLVGINTAGQVSGLEIIEQLETPGLGSHISSANFKAQFAGKTLADPLKAKKDIDAVTGATISTNAVCSGVRQALELNQGLKK